MGVTQAIANGLMGRCEMVWSTAGTNRVCSRCLSLKDTVVGHTDESGVTLPPLHPRCRCVIIYKEVGTARALQTPPKPTLTGRATDLQRDVISAETEFQEARSRTGRGASTAVREAQARLEVANGRLNAYVTGKPYRSPYPEVCGGVKCKIEFLTETLNNLGMSFKSKVYITPEGTRFIFPEDLIATKQTMTPETAIKVWNEVPKKIRRKAQNKVAFLDIENPYDAYWRSVYKNFTRMYATGGDEMIFYKYEDQHSLYYLKKTYCHEAGHFIDKNLGISTMWYSAGNEWNLAMKADEAKTGQKSVSDYGENSVNEDFAESVASYVFNKKGFKRRFPARAKLLKDILK